MSDIQWLTREDVGLILPNRWSNIRPSTTEIYFHHSGTADPSMPKSVEASKQQWRSIQRDHLSRLILDKDGKPTYWADGTVRKWADIAYNIGLGYRCVMDGRGLGPQGGGTGWPWDQWSISICVLGNTTIEQITPDLEETAVFALKEIRRYFGNDLVIKGDRDVNNTNCPGDNAYAAKQRWWDLSGSTPSPQVPTPTPPEEDEDMGAPLYKIRSDDPYEAWLVRWDNGKLSHLSPIENASPTYSALPTYIEDNREEYKRLVVESGTTWRPTK
ncbi:MAG: hypothetical protein DMF62_04730 [Acidobacteria bacterium]|nr:MAG: hypothetical protein DMF62_04730 [Acidobacteriota bacterium]